MTGYASWYIVSDIALALYQNAIIYADFHATSDVHNTSMTLESEVRIASRMVILIPNLLKFGLDRRSLPRPRLACLRRRSYTCKTESYGWKTRRRFRNSLQSNLVRAPTMCVSGSLAVRSVQGLIRLITKTQTVLPSLTLVDTTFDCGLPASMSHQQTTRVSGSRTYNMAYPSFRLELFAPSESRATRFRSAVRL